MPERPYSFDRSSAQSLADAHRNNLPPDRSVQSAGTHRQAGHNTSRTPDVVIVRNDTGAVLNRRFLVLKIGGIVATGFDADSDALVDQFLYNPILKGETPDASDNEFGIALRPAGKEDTVRCVTGGYVECLVEVTDTAHEYCAPKPGTRDKLISAVSGPAKIIDSSDAITGTDDRWCTIKIGAVDSGCATFSPGVHMGIAGGPIAAGDTGSVLVDGTEHQAINHSNCPVELNDRVVVGVSNDCDIFFTPCVCCSESTDCCDIFVAICICGDRQVLAVDGGNYTWDVLSCCDGCEEEAATLEITLSCEDPTITASWDYTCGETTDSGTVDLSSLCDDTNEVLIEDGISITGCSLNDSYANYLMECNTDTAECCVDWNASGASDGASEANANTNSVSGSSGGMTTVVSVNKFDTLFCQGQTITITMTVTGHDGSADPFIQWDKNLNSCGGTTVFSVQSHSPAGTVGATSVTWPGSGNGTYVVTLKWDSGCFAVGGAPCTLGTAVFEVEGVGGRDSGALHQYITTSSVT